MYFVDLINADNDVIVHAPFERKDEAIRYFNLHCDSKNYFVTNWNRIEIKNENIVLFDYEV